MAVLAIALAAGLGSALLWYLALAVVLDVALWASILVAVLGGLLAFFAIVRDTGRL